MPLNTELSHTLSVKLNVNVKQSLIKGLLKEKKLHHTVFSTERPLTHKINADSDHMTGLLQLTSTHMHCCIL